MMKRILALVLCMALLLSFMPVMSASAVVDSTELVVNKPVDVVIEDNELTFTFTPQQSGEYIFYSTGDVDTYASLIADGKVLSTSDDAQMGDYNFSIKYYLTKGQKYIYYVCAYSNGEFSICLQGEQTDMLTLNEQKEFSLEYKNNVKYEFTPQTSGYYCISSFGESDPSVALYTKDMEHLASNDNVDDESDNFRLVHYLQESSTYVYEFKQNDELLSDFSVLLQEGVGPKSVEVKNYPHDMTCIEKAESETVDLSGLELLYTMTDNSEVLWSYDKDNKVGDFAVNSEICVENNKCYVVLSCANTQTQIDMTVLENPVESIEIADGYVFEYYEYTCGYQGDFGYFYEYEEDLDKTEIIVNYKDGTSVTSKFCDTLEGLKFTSSDSQQEAYFELGTHYFTVTYAGVSANVPITILECPFESVVINSLPVKKYVMGEADYGRYFDKEFLFIPDYFEGLSFTLTLKDGSQITYDNDDFDYENQKLDGYEFYVNEIAAESPGVFETAINYKNFTIPFEVEAIDHPVKSVKVVKDPKVLVYEDIYTPDFTGMQIEITYKDNMIYQLGKSKETVTVSKDNLSYIDGRACVQLSGHKVFIDLNSSKTYTLKCYNLKYTYKNIVFVQSKKIKKVNVNNFTTDVVGTVIDVVFDDKTTQSLVVEDFYPNITDDKSDNDSKNYFCVTQKGIVEIEFYISDSDSGNDYYTVCVFGKEAVASLSKYKKGDVDLDGVVTVLDAVEIQRYAAEKITLNETQLECADIDGDSAVTVIDATQIQRFLANLIDQL